MTDRAPILADPGSRPEPALADRQVRATNAFIPFPKEEIEQSIPDRFEQQVRRYPDRLALKSRTRAFTYSELNEAANRMAHAILAERGEDEEPVALLFDQGAAAITAILGVLKAGKIYLPLEPRHPPARSAFLMEDAGTTLVVTDAQYFPLAVELAHSRCRVLCVDAGDRLLTTRNPGLSLSPDALAYIFYTSGSTGPPKGVADNHRNVLHNIMRYTNALHIGMEDRLTLLPAPAFSASVSSLFSALLNGASVFPFPLAEEGTGNLAEWLIREEITIYHSVPAIFRAFLTGEHRFPRLRLIRLQGDQAQPRDVELFRQYFAPDCILVNGLGATETGIVRQYFMDQETPLPDTIVPVGHAVEDMAIVLLDEAGGEVGVGDIGEIAVRSEYLAAGYWRKPELTRERFQPDPEGGGRRLYRTCDLGRMLAGDCLEYLGRKDFQARVRGHTVEIAAVEAALRGLAPVREAVVMTREDRPGEPRLVAYLVPAQRPAPTASALRRALAEALPETMIPSAFVMLDAVPLNANGKVDRRALPAPDRSRPALESDFVAPRDPIEEALGALYAEVLDLECVGVHDDFLALGGHSLLATQLITRMNGAFQVEVPLREFFREPTVAGLAGTLMRHEIAPGRVLAIAQLRNKVHQMSVEEVNRMLQARQTATVPQELT